MVVGWGFRGGGGVESESVGVDLEAEFEGEGEEGRYFCWLLFGRGRWWVGE